MDDAAPTKTLAKLGAWWGVRQEIAGAREQVDACWRIHFTRSWMNSRDRSGRCLSNRIKQHPTPSPCLHIAGKLLRYTVEMAEVEGHALPKTVLRTL